MSQNTVTYDQATPHRPGIDDVGGGAKTNATDPPDPVRHITAEDINQLSKQIVELAATACAAILVIKFTAGTPSIESTTGMGSAAKNPSTFTVTDLGVGHTRISWSAGVLSQRTGRHSADLADIATIGMISTKTISNGAEVTTLDNGASPADLEFVLFVMGGD